jgi:flagellar motor switch protein FliG
MGNIPVGRRQEIARFLRSLTPDEFDALLFHVPADEARELRGLVYAELAIVHSADGRDSAPTSSNCESDEERTGVLRFHARATANETGESTDGLENEEAVIGPPLDLPSQADSIDPIEQILRETEAATLCGLLADEHPQILAVVLALLPPDRSAEILGLLDADRQADCLRRIGSLDSPDPEALVVLRCELVNQIAREVEGGGNRTDSWEQVAAVVGSAPEHQRSQLCESLTRAFPMLKQRIPGRTVEEERSPPDESTLNADPDLRILQRLTTSQINQLIHRFGEAPFAMALATGDDEMWQNLLRRLPRERARRLTSFLAGTMKFQLADLELLQRTIGQSARELISNP